MALTNIRVNPNVESEYKFAAIDEIYLLIRKDGRHGRHRKRDQCYSCCRVKRDQRPRTKRKQRDDAGRKEWQQYIHREQRAQQQTPTPPDARMGPQWTFTWWSRVVNRCVFLAVSL